MSYEKDKLDSYVTSASLATALAPYITSNSVSAAIAGINLGPYMTSNSISAAVATNTLTVRGTASVSATLSAGAVTVAGRPVGPVLLGYQAVTNVTSVGFSGSWSDYGVLECRITYRASGTSTASIGVYSDGGTTPYLSISLLYPASTTGNYLIDWNVWGANATGVAYTNLSVYTAGALGASENSGTANTAFANCIR